MKCKLKLWKLWKIKWNRYLNFLFQIYNHVFLHMMLWKLWGWFFLYAWWWKIAKIHLRNTSMWLKPILLPQEDWAWSNLNTRNVIYCVFGFANIILQVNNEKKWYISRGSSLTMNFMIWIWKSLVFSQVIAHKMPHSKNCDVQVIGYVEDERCFTNLNFIKSKPYNQLTTHLTLVVLMLV